VIGTESLPAAGVAQRSASALERPVRLDLGCGTRRKDGWIGLDRHPCAGADVLGDLAHLPLADGCADQVLLDNVVEHVLDIPGMMHEVWRVCRGGARVHVVTPHFSSQASFRDPTHLHHLSYYSMDHFEKESASHYVGGGFRVRRRELVFSRSLVGRIGRVLFALGPQTWEKQFCFVFRARTLRFELEVVKGTSSA
jgi:hypothetical protein